MTIKVGQIRVWKEYSLDHKFIVIQKGLQGSHWCRSLSNDREYNATDVHIARDSTLYFEYLFYEALVNL